jgi:PAS domain S-box-containing protein
MPQKGDARAPLAGRADAFLAAIVESSVDAIKAKTLDGTLIFWNRACERMYGYSAEEAIGRNVSMVIAPERPNELTEILARIVAGERVEHYETERVCKDGTRIDVSISVSPIRDDDGAVVGAATIARDVTERKRAERGQRLLAAASRLFAEAGLDATAVLDGLCRAAVETIADDCVIVLVGDDGVTLRPAAVHDTDAERAALRRRVLTEQPLRVGEGMLGRVAGAGEPLLVPVMDDETRRDAMLPVHRPSAGELPVRSMLGAPLRAYGRTLGALLLGCRQAGRPYTGQDVGFVQELAERAAMALEAARAHADERRARREAEQLAAITRYIGQSLSLERVLDAVAGAASELLAAPVAGVFLLDPSGEWFELSAGRGLPAAGEPLRLPRRASLAGRAAAAGQAELVPDVRAAGVTALPVLVSGEAVGSLIVAPIGTPEAPSGVVEVYAPTPGAFTPRDAELLGVFAEAAGAAISNARLYEETERGMRAREEFLHVAAHELRSPITGLRGYAQMVARQIDRPEGLDLIRLRSGLARIDEQSRRLTDLVERLLDVTRLAAGRLEIERQRIDLAAVARQATEMVRERYADRQFVLHARRRVPLDADPVRIAQVLVNLVDNAAKFSPAGAPVEVEVAVEDGAAQVTVRDHGSGVPEGARERIFGRFEQGHAERHYGGLGLGLYISRQLVDLHGGTLSHEAPADGGARFVVRLPVAEESVAHAAGSGPVLVVDDDDTIRAVIAETLTDEGYDTMEANDGSIALELVREHPPRLILLDMRMPGMNGWEFAEAYRRLPGPHAPIVVVTGGGQPDVKAREIGADAYLVKPFEVDELVSMVARYVG